MFYSSCLCCSLLIILTQFILSPTPTQLHQNQSLPCLFRILPELFGRIPPVWLEFSTKLCPLNDNDYVLLFLSPLAEETSPSRSLCRCVWAQQSEHFPLQNVQYFCCHARKTLQSHSLLQNICVLFLQKCETEIFKKVECSGLATCITSSAGPPIPLAHV